MSSELPKDINIASIDEMFKYISKHASIIKEVSLFRNRISKAIEYIFNIKYTPKPNYPEWYSKLVPIDKKEIMDDKVKDYIKNKKLTCKKNIDIFEEYFAYYIGFRNRYGAFESVCGSKRAFSIYICLFFLMKL